MAGKPKVLDADIEKWLLNTAWKKHTLKEIALLSNINVTVIKRLYDDNEIKPITRRDQIASKILDLYNSAEPFPRNSELAVMFDCSGQLIKSIVDDFNLNSTTKAYKNTVQKVKQENEITFKLKTLQDHEKRIAAQKELRKTFTSYTQSGSDLIDHCRQMQTTLRPATYLTNNGKL